MENLIALLMYSGISPETHYFVKNTSLGRIQFFTVTNVMALSIVMTEYTEGKKN